MGAARWKVLPFILAPRDKSDERKSFGHFIPDPLERLDPDDFRRTHPFASLDLAPLRAALARVGERHDATAAQVALAWVAGRPGVTGAIVGIRSEREAEQLPGVGTLELDQDELREIETAVP